MYQKLLSHNYICNSIMLVNNDSKGRLLVVLLSEIYMHTSSGVVSPETTKLCRNYSCLDQSITSAILKLIKCYFIIIDLNYRVNIFPYICISASKKTFQIFALTQQGFNPKRCQMNVMLKFKSLS